VVSINGPCNYSSGIIVPACLPSRPPLPHAHPIPRQIAAVGVTVPGVLYLRKGSIAPAAEQARDFAKKEAKRAESVLTEAKVDVEGKMKEAKGEAEAKMTEVKGEAEAKMKEAQVGVESGVETAKETVEKAIGKMPPPPSMSSSGESSRASTPPSSP